MFRYENANPFSNRVGDCVVRAISKAMGKPWEEVYIELSIQGYLMGDIMNANAVWDKYLRNNGFTRSAVQCDCSSIAEFAEAHPQGAFVVGTGTHATALIDGAIYDIWDCSEEQPIYFYRKMGDED